MPIVHQPLQYAHTEGYTDVCFSQDGKKFITCGADGDVRICSVKENDYPVNTCVGEWATCVRQAGDSVYVATGSNDIQILTYPDGQRTGILERFAAPINHIAINKEHNLIAMACEDMEVKLKKLDGDKEMITFDGIEGPCLSVAFSPNSQFLAVGAGDGKLRIWDIKIKALIKTINCFPKANSFSNAKNLCRVDFSPKDNMLAYAEKNKIIILNTKNWDKICELNDNEINEEFSIVQFSFYGEYLAASSLDGDLVIWDMMRKTVYDKTKHPNSLSICSFMWNSENHDQIVYTDIEGYFGLASGCCGDMGDSLKDIPSSPPNRIESNESEKNDVDFTGVEFEDDNDDVDDENVVSLEKIKKQYENDIESELQTDAASTRLSTPRPKTPVVPLQPPFMPSSTPEHLDLRYLCWNEVAVIRSYGTDDEVTTKSIEIEFHETSFHNSMSLQNYQDYTMASVSKSALITANTDQINVIPLIGGSKEWMLKVEEHEEIILISASENLISFAVNSNILRIVSIYGTQRGIVLIPGPLVSLNSYKNLILVAYHYASPRNNDQCINFKLIKVDGLTMECKDLNCGLSPDSTLRWLGFSDNGTPSILDSNGLLCLSPNNCGLWIPFCDTKKHLKSPSDTFFVTTVFEKYQTVGGIKCKGTLYPGFTPRPTVGEIPLEPPFSEVDTEKTKWEMDLFTWTNLQVQDVDKKYKETGLRTFVLACKNNLDHRALELVELLGDPQILTLAIKYASKVDKRRLAEKLMELAERLTSDPEESNSKQNEIPTPVVENKIMPLKMTSKYKTPKKLSENVEISSPNISQLSTTLTPMESSMETLETLTPEPKNPFAKKRNENESPNPLSLTDKYAGFDYKESEKRKQPEAGGSVEKPKKQRKLDPFTFKLS